MEKFSKQIKADEDGYYMSCPEFVAKHIANQCRGYRTAAELCCAVGTTTIQLAKVLDKVVGVDSDAKRIENAKYNAKLYGVSDKTNFIVGDVLDEHLLQTVDADVAILDPDWKNNDTKDYAITLDDTTPSMKKMIELTRKHITENLVLRVPKIVTFEILSRLGPCRIENIVFEGRVRFKVAYFLPDIKNEEIIVNFD